MHLEAKVGQALLPGRNCPGKKPPPQVEYAVVKATMLLDILNLSKAQRDLKKNFK
jgi:hypothetical protein